MTAHETHPLLEKLTAVLMNEADAATRQEIQRALQTDAKLVAIQHRLQATIDLVQTELGDGATLAPHRVEDLMISASTISASRVSDPIPIGGFGALMRAAAAVVILSGGVWTALQLADQNQVLITDDAGQDERIAAIARANLMGQLLYRQAHPRHTSGQIDSFVLDQYQYLAAQERYAIEVAARPEDTAAAGESPEEEEVVEEVDDERLYLGAVKSQSGRARGLVGQDLAGEKGGVLGKIESLRYGGRAPASGNAPEAAGNRSASEVIVGSTSIASTGPTSAATSPGKSSSLSSQRGMKGKASASKQDKWGQAVTPDPSSSPIGGGGGAGLSLGVKKEALGPIEARNGVAGRTLPPVIENERRLERAQDSAGSKDFFFGHDARVLDQIEIQDYEEPAAVVRQPIHLPSFEDTVEGRFQDARQRCLVQTNDRLPDLYQHWWGDNPWELTLADSQATFGADVDTASYGAARNKLLKGQLPGRAGIRTEEFVNYFRPDLVAPTSDALALSVEMAPSLSRDGNDRWLLRVGVRAKDIQAWERDPLALVLVVDVSGSMKHYDRMGIVKRAVERMLDSLDSRDTLAIVTFNKEAKQVLPPTSVSARDAILEAAASFTPGGGTNAALGLQLGYELAAQGVAPGVISRVVLLSDGLANTGETDQTKILESVREHLNAGVHLNTLGVGIEGHNDTFLERLADGGDGLCDFVDDDRAIQRALGERFAGAFIPVADDVKIQVEFNGRQVVRWRQLGYENRAIADASFRDDAVDAGEVGASHQVTALFEVELDRGLVYDGTPLATARLRWKEPKVGGQDNTLRVATERTLPIMAQKALAHRGSTSAGYRRAAVTAQFAEFLRRSVHARGDSVPALLDAAEALLHDRELSLDEDTHELVRLIQKAVELGLEEAQLSNGVQAATDDLREIEHVCRQLDSLPGRMNTGDRNRLGSARRQAQERLRQAISDDEQRAREAAGWSQSGILLVDGQSGERKR